MRGNRQTLETIIRKVVAEQLGQSTEGFQRTIDPETGVTAVKTASVTPEILVTRYI